MKHMKQLSFLGLAVAIVFTLSGCEVIGGIFKAGVWSGVLLVVGIIALIVYLLTRGNRKN